MSTMSNHFSSLFFSFSRCFMGIINGLLQVFSSNKKMYPYSSSEPFTRWVLTVDHLEIVNMLSHYLLGTYMHSESQTIYGLWQTFSGLFSISFPWQVKSICFSFGCCHWHGGLHLSCHVSHYPKHKYLSHKCIFNRNNTQILKTHILPPFVPRKKMSFWC